MEINADFNQRVVIHSSTMEWLESPMAGVYRRPLDRVGDEVARATTIVKYLPNSHFSSHVHTGGEEFLVLEGVFQDQHGSFPTGSYIRNPPESSHQPSSETGCIMLVKLWQFEDADRIHVRLNHQFMNATPDNNQSSVSKISLYHDGKEEVMIQDWQAGANIKIIADKGIEVFVLEGGFVEQGDSLGKHSWLRLPLGSTLNATVSEQGAKVWIKKDHLARVDAEVQRIKAVNQANKYA